MGDREDKRPRNRNFLVANGAVMIGTLRRNADQTICLAYATGEICSALSYQE